MNIFYTNFSRFKDCVRVCVSTFYHHVAGPGAMEAIANGCIYIQPHFPTPINRANHVGSDYDFIAVTNPTHYCRDSFITSQQVGHCLHKIHT